jgi:hypothetical protein
LISVLAKIGERPILKVRSNAGVTESKRLTRR